MLHFLEVFLCPGRRMIRRKVSFFIYGKVYTSLNISIDGLQSICRYQLRVSRGPHIFCLGLALIELVKHTWWTFTHFYYLAKFTKRFRQVQQVQALNKNYEDLCWPLIDAYKLAVTHQYLYLMKYEFSRRKEHSHFLGVVLLPGWNHPHVYCRVSFCVLVII